MYRVSRNEYRLCAYDGISVTECGRRAYEKNALKHVEGQVVSTAVERVSLVSEAAA